MMKGFKLVAMLCAVLLAFAVVPAAWAHSFIEHCTPDVGATLATPPTELRCTFTEAIDVKQTKIDVIDARANTVDNGDLKADPNDNKGLNVILTFNTARMTGGVYTVRWATVSEDGHATDGQFQFSVNAQPAPSISIVTPTDSSTFDTDPSDVPVTVNVANFPLGQGGRNLQIFIDSNLMATLSDGSTSTTLKGVKAGDYALKVALVTGDGTVVATAGVGISVGPAETAPAPTQPAQTAQATPVPATPAPSTTTAPSTLPKTGPDASTDLALALSLVAGGLALLGVGCLARRSR
jgi:methionine-rich copper-binding protein CopC